MSNAVIVKYVRTPFTAASVPGKREGQLADIYPDNLGAALTSHLITSTKIDPKAIQAVIAGCAFGEGPQGLNVARMIVLNPASGLTDKTAGTTVNQFCGSSLHALVTAASQIIAFNKKAYICVGLENMSINPKMAGFKPMINPLIAGGNVEGFMNMGRTAENLARIHGIRRTLQEEFAMRSHQKAAAAQAAGKFDAEIVPITREDGTVVSKDDLIRKDSSMESLAKLKPAFLKDGTVTAGTSSPFTDGASAVLVTSEAFAKANNLPIMARILSFGETGCAPEIMGIGPVEATREALKAAGLTMDRIGVIELNEAFAAQSLAVMRELGINEKKLNLDGGAIALGHPLGATGARIVGKVASLLQRENKQYGLATMCIGGGQGIAMVLERHPW